FAAVDRDTFSRGWRSISASFSAEIVRMGKAGRVTMDQAQTFQTPFTKLAKRQVLWRLSSKKVAEMIFFY
ncbi:hypothetical protein JW824_09225, partial [bacterium]|nr:hypothetical protein [bacterium]